MIYSVRYTFLLYNIYKILLAWLWLDRVSNFVCTSALKADFFIYYHLCNLWGRSWKICLISRVKRVLRILTKCHYIAIAKYLETFELDILSCYLEILAPFHVYFFLTSYSQHYTQTFHDHSTTFKTHKNNFEINSTVTKIGSTQVYFARYWITQSYISLMSISKSD